MVLTPHRKPLPSLELKILKHLDSRMNLPADYKTRFGNLYKGYEGEQKFFTLIKNELLTDSIPLFDLLLESGESEFQIDNLLIFNRTINLIEVKNYEGDFFIKGDKWYAVASGKEIRNPLLQLKRSEFLLRQLLQQLGYNFSIEAYLVFVHQEFTLYQAPYDQSLILPTQLNRFMKKLNTIPSTITKKHTKLAEQLAHRHIEKSAQERLPAYDYQQLEKGIVCNSCQDFLTVLNMTNLRCRRCGHKESVEAAVMRTVAEFHLLFPDRKITTSEIYNWCKIISSKNRIRRI